jgi:hypothetical protein
VSTVGAGAVVFIGRGRVQWRVEAIEGTWARLRHPNGSQLRRARLDRLTPVSQPTEGTPDDGPVITWRPDGCVTVDGDVIRGGDIWTATVVEWDAPIGDKGTDPSMVGICCRDDQDGAPWVTLTADGPEQAACLSPAAARRLLAALAAIVRDIDGERR